ncbi:Heat shock protein 82 [Capsicum baccatum]|uniref:Heat shock protein 82 n=1 Tax=Capsicum baccatum TaxID=33114 RepID=A0A2G2WNX6_CAPBA|nr:Heat shock protein 82 [Capsicum baccatum]
MTSKQEYFTKLKSAKGSVKLANKTKLEIVGKGTVAIEAPKVILTTKHNDDEQYIWESQTCGLFTVTRDVNVEQLGRGTKITLFLKEDQLKYLEEQRIKDLVKKHSEFISYPIYLWAEKTTEKEISNDEDDEPKKDNEGSSKQALLKLTQDQGGNYLFEFDSFPDDTRLRKSTFEKPYVPHDEQLTETEMRRRIKLLQKLHRQLVIGGILLEAVFWAVRKRLLEQTENKKSKQQTKYSRVEYLHSTKNVVATFAEVSEDEEHAVFLKQDAMLESEARKKMNNIKLYVWRVFIMDNCEELMPEYLGFVKGVVDSDDLSLNISHEMLQQNEILKVIRKNLVKKCIEMFNEIAETKEKLKLVDIFTNALPKFRFETLREQLGVTSKHLKEEC